MLELLAVRPDLVVDELAHGVAHHLLLFGPFVHGADRYRSAYLRRPWAVRRTSSARSPSGRPSRCARSRSGRSRVIHFFDPRNEKMAAKVPDMVGHGRRAARQPRGRHQGRPTRRPPAPGWSRSARTTDFGDDPAVDPGQRPRLARGCLDDLTTLVTEIGDKLDVIMVPKVQGAEDIHYVDRLLAQLEAKAGLDRPILVHAILETARGVANVEEICGASPADAGARRSARPTSPPTGG